MTRLRSPVLAFGVAHRTDAGQVRGLNEDRLLSRPEAGLWAVADGMGGHAAGEVASGLIVEALADLGDYGSGYAYLNAVQEALRQVNGDLVARAAADSSTGGVIGSTVVALLIFQDHFACVWAGDSRAYQLRGGQLQRLTRDHSVVQQLVDAGALTPQQARLDRRANVVTRALGAHDGLDLDLAHGEVRPGDRFLLCSDGLTGVVEDEEIAALLAAPSLQSAADALLAKAHDRGSPDNVTLVLIEAKA
jgi:serine/threonine protein phosphatase PrpC